MRAFSASDLLFVLENGAGTTPAEQALTILRAGFPRASDAMLLKLTIGQRDACLLRLRELTFGPLLKGLSDCPSCGERLELTCDTHDLLALNDPLPDPETVEPLNVESSFRFDTYELTYRLPTSADLFSFAGQTDVSLLRQELLQACTVSVLHEGVSITVGDLPMDVMNALAERVDAADPLANLTLSATCPACGHAWQVIFDIVSYFWSEINAWSARLLREVHLFASAYGWPESDILEMSAWRRQRYLELIGL